MEDLLKYLSLTVGRRGKKEAKLKPIGVYQAGRMREQERKHKGLYPEILRRYPEGGGVSYKINAIREDILVQTYKNLRVRYITTNKPS